MSAHVAMLAAMLAAAVPAAPASDPTTPPDRASSARARPAVETPLAKPHATVHRPDAAAAAAIERANAQARDGPAAGAYVNSAIYHAYEPGRIYSIRASPRFLTTVALRPGEKLISKAAGDTVRWVMGETLAGSGPSEQVIIFIKPIRPDLRTNIVLTTDQRTYLIDAVSGTGAGYTSVLSWNYPQEEALAMRQAQGAERATSDVALDRLDFSYRIDVVRGRAPRWTPQRAFDDGRKTFIAFPPDLAATQAPPLFLLGPDGGAELVNYRLQGTYYVVDGLFDQAELRLGEKKQTIVRITRTRARS